MYKSTTSVRPSSYIPWYTCAKLCGYKYKPDILKELVSDANEPAFTIAIILLHPKSVGSLRLASTDPFDPPLIDPQYITDQRDLEAFICLYVGCESGKSSSQHRPCRFCEYKLKILFEAIQITNRPLLGMHNTPSYETVYHPVWTCKMGGGGRIKYSPQLHKRGLGAGLNIWWSLHKTNTAS